MNYMYFQSLVQYRIPVLDDGTFGQPEVTSKFTTEVKGQHKKPKTVVKQLTSVITKEVEEI